jgi:zinc protease
VDSLVAAALAEVQRLHDQGPNTAEMNLVKAAETRDRDGRYERNSYWAGELSSHARMAWPLSTIADHEKDLERLTIHALRDACRRFLDTTRHTRVTMYPAR